MSHYMTLGFSYERDGTLHTRYRVYNMYIHIYIHKYVCIYIYISTERRIVIKQDDIWYRTSANKQF